ncbi:MAG: PHP domain-containing protein [Solirubrobacteraceae bacterium]
MTSPESAPSLAVAQVSPYPLESGHPVTAHVLRLSDELAALGHRVVILAPSSDPDRVHATRRRLREPAAELLPAPGGAPTVLAVGEALTLLPGGGRSGKAATLPVDAARAVEDALVALPLDIVHVHEPYGLSVPTVALRQSRTLNVGTFHQPTDRPVAGVGPGVGGSAITRKRVERLLGRLDERLAASETSARLLAQWFPIGRGYRPRVPPPPAHVLPTRTRPPVSDEHPLHIVLPLGEERAARRAALRALRRLDPGRAWRATVLVSGGEGAVSLRKEIRDRVRFVDVEDLWAQTVGTPGAPSGRAGGGVGADATAGDRCRPALPPDADVVVLASPGVRPAVHVLVEALHAGVIPVCSRIDAYEELTDGDTRGSIFTPGDTEVLVGQLHRLADDADLRDGLRSAAGTWAAGSEEPGAVWAGYAEWVVERYDAIRARRHDPTRFDPAVIARLRERPLIDVDLHMHTDHSHDCVTPVEVLLDTARRQGLGAIAVTDHNEVSGALEAAEKAARFGVKVIVGEEVKTADQGEVIGLFIQERIPKGVTLQEAIADIRRQGGLVYVPHPFDRMHSVPDYEHMLDIVEEIDAIEVFNPRVAVGSFNEEAARFAEKYRIVAGAGSDSHVAQGLGSVRLRMPDFDGPEEFLASLAQADIQTKSGTLVYVQALKFLETKATPAPARRRVRERRVRRATRD